jgi:hypothetical protein
VPYYLKYKISADSEGKYLNLLKDACVYLVKFFELFEEVITITIIIIYLFIYLF